MFIDDIIDYVENLKEVTATKNLLELINGYSKFVGCNVNIQKSITYLYTRNMHMRFEVENTVPRT